MRRGLLALIGVTLLCCALIAQIVHAEGISSSWSASYARYARPQWLELSAGTMPWRSLVGMHPPAWAILTASAALAGASLRELMVMQLLMWQTAAVAGALLLARAHGAVGALVFLGVVGLAPIQVHYASELNNYPLLQLATALLAVAVAATWTRPTHRRLLGLALVVGLALWSHFATGALVLALGVCAVATRRWPVALATAVGVVIASPTLWSALSLVSSGQTFHNEALGAQDLAPQLLRVWSQRFVPDVASASCLGASASAIYFGLRDPRSRPLTVLLCAMFVVALTWVLAGFTSGAAFFRQTPYWIGCSWLGAMILGLGFGAAPRHGRLGILLVLAPWVLAAGAWHLRPAQDWDFGHPADPDGTSAAARYVVEELRPEQGDVLIYLWEGFENDQPAWRDPVYAAIRPRDLAPFVGPSEPLSIATSRWRGAGRLVDLGRTVRGENHELAEAILEWTTQGRVVHLVQPGWDRGLGPPDFDWLRTRLVAEGVHWTPWAAGRAFLVRLER